MLSFDRFEVLTVDCYGTLIDWEPGILSALKPLLASRDVFLPDEELLELYAEFESAAERGAYIPYRSVLRKTVKEFGIRKGEPIAAVVTLRREQASEFLARALEAIGNKVRETSFDNYGNFSFGIKEHIEIPGTKYVPELGIFGATIHITLERPGYRVRRRSIRASKIGRGHYVSRQDAISFMQSNFRTQIIS